MVSSKKNLDVKPRKKLTGLARFLVAYVVVGLLGIIVCGYGYAAMSTDLLISGSAKVKAKADIEITKVDVTKTENGAIEGNNNAFTASSVTMYPQLPNADGRIVYTIRTCNNSNTKRYELTNMTAPVASLNTSLLYFENLIVGNASRLGEILEPGECLDSEVHFLNAAGNPQIAAYQLKFDWKEYTGVGFDIEYMQDMTPQVCGKVTAREQKQLIDKRDNKKYWVIKMKDGSCWMAQNLALDIVGENQTLYPETSDVTEVRKIKETTNAWVLNGVGTNDNSFAANNTQHSWSVGNVLPATADPAQGTSSFCFNKDYYMPNQSSYGSMKTGENLGVACADWGFTDVSGWDEGFNVHYGFYKLPNGATYAGPVTVNTEKKQYDSHYLLGNYYQWNTVTAGTGETTNTEFAYASDSICPKGWQLMRQGIDPGGYMHLLSAYGFTVDSKGVLKPGDGTLTDLQVEPLYQTRAGWMDPYDGYLMWVGYISSMWTAMASKYQGVLGITSYAPYYDFQNVYPFGATYYRFFGMSVRCVAKGVS